jgi:CHAT domain-containing protein
MNTKIKILFSLIIFICLNQVSFSQNNEVWKQNIDKSDEFLAKKDYKNALDWANKSLVDVKKTFGVKNEREFTILGKIGKIYYLQGNYDKAIEYYTLEKDLIVEIKGANSAPYARSINNLSVLYQTMGKSDKVESLLIESVKIKKEILGENDTSYAKSLNNLGQYYLTAGKFPEAESLFLQSLEIKKKHLAEDDASYGLTMINLGLLYKAIGDNTKAKALMEEAYNQLKKSLSDDDPELVNAIFNLGILYLQTGEKDKAAPLIAKSKAIEGKLSSDLKISSATSLYNLAQLKIGLKENAEAQAILENLIIKFKAKFGNSHPLYVQIIRTLGVSYWIDEKYNKAFECLKEAMALTQLMYDEDNVNYATALHNFAGLLKEMKEFETAEEYYKKSFDIYKLQIDKYFPYYSEAEKAKFYLNLKEKFEMYNCFIIQRVIDNPTIVGEMYDFQLATKGVLLNYSKKLRKSIYSSNQPALIKKYDDWIIQKEYLVKLYNMSRVELKQTKVNLDSLELYVNGLEKELSLASSQYGNESSTGKYNWKDIQKKLKPNEAAVEIIRFKFFNKGWADSTYYAAMVLTAETKDFPVLIIHENGNDMDKSYLKNYKSLIKSKFPDKKSYNAYWSKIEEFIKDKDVVYVSLDGVYNNININTLQRPDNSYVLDNKSIYIVSNTKDIFDIEKTKNVFSANPNAILLGAPTFNIQGNNFKVKDYTAKEDLNVDENINKIEISELPGTKLELDVIGNLLNENKWKVEKFTEKNASENTFKTFKSPSLLHVATHGYFFNGINDKSQDRVFGVDVEKAAQNPLLRSGLLLAGASNSLNFDFNNTQNDENGVLTAYETMNLNLDKTNLVVMSACETGLGEVMNGEGVYGLQRAFLISGAKSLIMSLWTVDDKATQELMTTFYGNWIGGQPIGKAFRNAQLKLKENYKQPYYWGAFILLGEVN